MPKVSEAHLEARRSQILEAAFDCFGEKGFHGTTMRDICRRAELSPGAVYRYFQSKDEILEALAHTGRRSTRRFLESMSTPEEAPAALAALVRGCLQVLDNPEGSRGFRFDVRFWGEALHTPRLQEVFRTGFDNASRPFVEVVRRGQEAGEIDPELAPEGVARVAMALFLGLGLQRVLDPEADLESSGEALEALLGGDFTTEKKEKKGRGQ